MPTALSARCLPSLLILQPQPTADLLMSTVRMSNVLTGTYRVSTTAAAVLFA